MDIRCLSYSITVIANGVIALNVLTTGGATLANESEVYAEVILDDTIEASNYNVASSSSGGFSTSAAALVPLAAGTHATEFCIGGEDLATWTARFNYTILSG